MGNCCSGPCRRSAFLPVLLLVLTPIVVGCATSKPRFAAPSTAVSAQPTVVVPTESVTTVPTEPAAPEPAVALEVRPVAYQQSVEEIPAVNAAENGHPLDMSTVLALVAGQNPQVAFSQSRIREAYANLQAANVLWLPTIQTGVSYNRHEGNLQDSSGAILDVNRSSLQAGLVQEPSAREQQRNRASSLSFIWLMRYSNPRLPNATFGHSSTPTLLCSTTNSLKRPSRTKNYCGRISCRRSPMKRPPEVRSSLA